MIVVHHNLPLVSVITPSYNQGAFIRETINSVLFQDYPNIELIVVDGGSTDDTLAILTEYSHHFGDRFRFISEKDRGQSHAVNKGLAMAGGEIIGWLNSDDTYHPGAIQKAVQALLLHPDWAIVQGNAYTIDESGRYQSPYYVAPADFQKLFHGCMICQPAVFLRKQVFQQVGGVDETLRFCMDYDLWIRIAKQYTIGYLNEHLANARTHGACKTSTLWSTVGIREVLKTCAKHYGTFSDTWLSAYLGYHRDKGISGFLHYLEDQSGSGVGPRVTGMNRYEDLWVPPHFTVSVEADPANPLHTLLIKGKILSPNVTHLPTNYRFKCSSIVNGQKVQNYVVGTSFVLEVPVHSDRTSHEIEIVSSHYFSTGNPPRMVSFIADEVVALSTRQADYYRMMAASPLLMKNA